eukprot:RCo039009
MDAAQKLAQNTKKPRQKPPEHACAQKRIRDSNARREARISHSAVDSLQKCQYQSAINILVRKLIKTAMTEKQTWAWHQRKMKKTDKNAEPYPAAVRSPWGTTPSVGG